MKWKRHRNTPSITEDGKQVIWLRREEGWEDRLKMILNTPEAIDLLRPS